MDLVMAIGLLVFGGSGVWYFLRNRLLSTVKDTLLKHQIEENDKQIDILETEAETIEQKITESDENELSDREAYARRQREIDAEYAAHKNNGNTMTPDEAAEELAAALKKYREAEREGK